MVLSGDTASSQGFTIRSRCNCSMRRWSLLTARRLTLESMATMDEDVQRAAPAGRGFRLQSLTSTERAPFMRKTWGHEGDPP